MMGKSMNKTVKVLFFSICFFLNISLKKIYAEENASIQIDLNFVSNYVWRGHDFFRNYAIQNQRSFGSHTGTWAFQPSITWNTPVSGLYANLFSSTALNGRQDKDIDQRIQKNPSTNFIAGRTSLLDYFFDPTIDLLTDIYGEFPITNRVSDFIYNPDSSTTTGIPNFYREPVGLKRNDELDITIGYEKDTKIGIIGFGILHYSYANINQVGNPYGTEIFISYALPFLKALKYSIYNDMRIHTIYYNINYSGDYELTKDITSSYSIGAGYYVFNQVQGISDITLNYTISHSSGFNIGFNVVYRPDLKIQDYYFGSGDFITGEVNIAKLPIDINGESTIYDGKVADPSKSLGAVNEYINNLLSTNISNTLGIPYTYTPRQKLPRYLWWISIGYSITIE